MHRLCGQGERSGRDCQGRRSETVRARDVERIGSVSPAGLGRRTGERKL